MSPEARLPVDDLNAETPIPLLDGSIVPVPAFYVRSHFPTPPCAYAAVDAHVPGSAAAPGPAAEPESAADAVPAAVPESAASAAAPPSASTSIPAAAATPLSAAPPWRLRIGSEAGLIRDFDLASIRALGSIEREVTLECAGNSRTRMEPRPPGVPWGEGAVGTARFRGVLLSALAEAVGLQLSDGHVWLVGADSGIVDGGIEPFGRSLPLREAVRLGAMLAWEMNGSPLTPEHGAPLRAVVPGRYAVDSVKWIERVEFRATEWPGRFQQTHYRYEGEAGTPDGTPVGLMRVRAVIAEPARGVHLPPGVPVVIRGSAWSGAGAIAGVEVSTDGGATWTPAQLALPAEAQSPGRAVAWSRTWTPPGPGEATLMARARDTAGGVQPLAVIHNRQGYGNHAVLGVPVRVG